MDHQQLRTLVFEKTGIKVDSNDPIFALVALNETVLAEAVDQHVALINDATAHLDALLRQLPGGALPALSPRPSPSASLDWRLLAGAAAVALTSALVVLGGQALFGHANPPAAAAVPPPAPAPVAILTPEQSALLQTGEKFNRVLKRLDEPTRTKLQAEMRKP